MSCCSPARETARPTPCVRPGAIQQPPVTQPFQGLGPGQALDVRQELQDATAHVGLMVAPCPATWASDVDGQRTLAPVTPFAGRWTPHRVPEQLPCHRLQQGRPISLSQRAWHQHPQDAPQPGPAQSSRCRSGSRTGSSAACSTLLTACRIVSHGLQPQSEA